MSVVLDVDLKATVFFDCITAKLIPIQAIKFYARFDNLVYFSFISTTIFPEIILKGFGAIKEIRDTFLIILPFVTFYIKKKLLERLCVDH